MEILGLTLTLLSADLLSRREGHLFVIPYYHFYFAFIIHPLRSFPHFRFPVFELAEVMFGVLSLGDFLLDFGIEILPSLIKFYSRQAQIEVSSQLPFHRLLVCS